LWWQHRHPDAPSLTAEATSLLDRLLRSADRGIEWGSGNSTRWLARRTAHLLSLETGSAYHARVVAALAREGLNNTDYRLVPFRDDPDEALMHRSPWVRVVDEIADASLDYALVDSSPRGCLCSAVAPKIKPGGLLILDNANWYVPPPKTALPAPGSVTVALGSPGSAVPDNRCWPAFLEVSASWRACWTSDGVQMTLVLIKA
jgi:predicted O-methyltransferase YrrM